MEAERASAADIQGYLKEILDTLRNFYPDEHSMLEYLAAGDLSTFSDFAKFSPEYVEHLIGYGIVIQRGDDFEFAFDAVAESMKKSLNASSNMSIEQRWKDVGTRRNVLESEMRTALYRWSMRLSEDEWNSVFRRCVTGARIETIGILPRREAFSRNNSPLYLIELLKFVIESGEFLGIIRLTYQNSGCRP